MRSAIELNDLTLFICVYWGDALSPVPVRRDAGVAALRSRLYRSRCVFDVSDAARQDISDEVEFLLSVLIARGDL